MVMSYINIFEIFITKFCLMLVSTKQYISILIFHIIVIFIGSLHNHCQCLLVKDTRQTLMLSLDVVEIIR